MKTANNACLRVACTLNEVESGIDTLLGKAGELLTEIARAREATGHTAQDIQRPLTRVANLHAKLIEARSQILHAHGDLKKLGQTMDIPFECPTSGSDISAPTIGQNVFPIAC